MTSDISITDFVDFNPKRRIQKGTAAPFVDMAALPVDSRDISAIGERVFKGGGSKFMNGDTLFARITPCLENGKTAKVSGLPEKVVASGSTEFIVMAAKEPEYDEDYVYYLARLPEFRAYAQARMEGTSGRQRVPWQSLAGFTFDFPGKEARKVIGRVLKVFDDKIELNRQTNQTLEQMAQAIYKSWFVDFEPTRAKIIAKEKGANTAIQELAAQAIICGAMTLEKLEAITQNLETTLQQAINEKLSQANQTPINTEQLKTTAALFPNALVESDGVTNSSETSRLIPEGWEVQTLEDVIELAYGKALKKTVRVEGDFPVYGSGGLTGTHNDALVEGPGVIVGRKGTVGSLYWEDSSFYPIDTVFYVKPKSSITLVYAYSLLQTLGLADMNTDAAVPGLNRNNVYRLDIVKPPEKLILIFSKLIGSFRERLSLNKQESKFLVEVRDLLLPKLLSGDLPI